MRSSQSKVRALHKELRIVLAYNYPDTAHHIKKVADYIKKHSGVSVTISPYKDHRWTVSFLGKATGLRKGLCNWICIPVTAEDIGDLFFSLSIKVKQKYDQS